MAVRQTIVGRDTLSVGQPDQPEVPVPLWQSADGEDTLGVGGQLVLGLQSRRDCRMPKTTTWTSWDLSTVPRLSHSYPPARATFTFRDKAACGRSVGTLLARSLGAVTFSSLQAHPPRVPQFFVSIRNRGSWSGATNAKDNADPVRVEKAFPATVTKAQFRPGQQDNALPRTQEVTHPRRVGSTFLLSGLVKCYTCKRALSAASYSKQGDSSPTMSATLS